MSLLVIHAHMVFTHFDKLLLSVHYVSDAKTTNIMKVWSLLHRVAMVGECGAVTITQCE